MEQNKPVKFLSDVKGVISTNGAGQPVSLTKYVVLSADGDVFISGITHRELTKLAAKLMEVGMEQALLYNYAGNSENGEYDDAGFTEEVDGMMAAALSYEGTL
jgi:hypothetical protein